MPSLVLPGLSYLIQIWQILNLHVVAWTRARDMPVVMGLGSREKDDLSLAVYFGKATG